jgi:hypothetical protein
MRPLTRIEWECPLCGLAVFILAALLCLSRKQWSHCPILWEQKIGADTEKRLSPFHAVVETVGKVLRGVQGRDRIPRVTERGEHPMPVVP